MTVEDLIFNYINTCTHFCSVNHLHIALHLSESTIRKYVKKLTAERSIKSQKWDYKTVYYSNHLFDMPKN